MFANRDIILFALVAGILAVAALAVWPWARSRGRFLVVERREPAGRVVGAAAIAGLAALVVDLFVL